MKSHVDTIIKSIQLAGAVKSRALVESLDQTDLSSLLARVRTMSDAKFGKILKAYIPGNKFPAISVTGPTCDLQCKHCEDHYLHGMIPAETPAKLEQALDTIHKSGGTGALISGGSTRDGIVEMRGFHDVLAKITGTTGLKLNVHAGLIDKATAERLHATGVEAISLDLVGDDGTIRGIYGLGKSVDDYKAVLRGLIAAGFTNEQIIPHICIGLDKGKVVGEYAVLDYIAELHPRLVVFIVIIPPKHLAGHDFINVAPVDVSRIIAITRVLYPATEISLGCMRPGGSIRNEYDLAAFKAGITRIAIPTNALVKRAEQDGYVVQRVENCCAIGSLG